MKKIMASNCTIKRVKVVHHSTINMVTGKEILGKTETVTEECGTPLFGAPTGICRSCHEGWEAEGNTFASEKEKRRAAAGRPS